MPYHMIILKTATHTYATYYNQSASRACIGDLLKPKKKIPRKQETALRLRLLTYFVMPCGALSCGAFFSLIDGNYHVQQLGQFKRITNKNK